MFVEILRFVVGHPSLYCSINHAVQASSLVLLGEHRDVVLEGIRNPEALEADIGDALMRIPVIFVGKRLVNAVVEILVMREYDMATDVVELRRIRDCSSHSQRRVQLTKPSGVTSVEASPPGVLFASTIIHEGPSCGGLATSLRSSRGARAAYNLV